MTITSEKLILIGELRSRNDIFFTVFQVDGESLRVFTIFSPNPRIQSAYSRTDSAKPSDREPAHTVHAPDPSGTLFSCELETFENLLHNGQFTRRQNRTTTLRS